MINMRRNTADNMACPLRKKKLRLTMSKPRVFAGRQQAVHFILERGDPVRIIRIKPKGQIDKGDPV
jgi:hypothetical protein